MGVIDRSTGDEIFDSAQYEMVVVHAFGKPVGQGVMVASIAAPAGENQVAWQGGIRYLWATWTLYHIRLPLLMRSPGEKRLPCERQQI